METLEKIFSAPPARFRPVPQWSWNGDLTRERITAQIEQFAARGCGGVFPHARSGHVTGYLTERWFELWDFAVREAERLGLQLHLYDEFVCPSGVAGGNVISENPLLRQREIGIVPAGPGRTRGEILLRVRISGEGIRLAEADTDATHQVVLGESGNSHGAPAPDLLNPETAPLFFRLTHERYRARSGDAFGKTVVFMFSDEPMILASAKGFPFSRHLQMEFQREHGYALEGEKLLSLCFANADSPAVRFDFWATVNRLFNQNFLKPMHDWCEANGLLFTGHLMEHDWPAPRSTPDNMSGLRWMHAPGEDLLGFQFTPTRLRDNGLFVLNLKELSSVGNQLDRAWRMVETCGGGGYQTAFSYFKPCEDFTLSFGVNLIDPHLAHETLSGVGKYDWPQTMSDHSPWWEHYRAHADHVARVNAVLSQGREMNRVLVLMPTTTGWMHYAGGDFDAINRGSSTEKLEWLRASQIELVTALYEEQIDFDLGDEIILGEFARVENGKLKAGPCEYDAVVIPSAMETLNRSTLELLRGCAHEGIVVHALSVPERVDGRKSDEPARLAAERGWINHPGDVPALVEAIRKSVPPRVSSPDGTAVGGGLVWRRAVTPEGDVWFFCNPWSEPAGVRVRLKGASAFLFDTENGSVHPLAADRDGDSIIIELNLHPRGHELILVQDAPPIAADVAPGRMALRNGTRVELARREVRRLDSNLLYLDYCDVSANGQSRADINTALADELNWRWQGFEGNPWERQFRRTLVDHPTDPESSVGIAYRFNIGATVTEKTMRTLRVAIERPWLYRIELNGTALDLKTGVRWFDEEMRAFPVGAAVRSGENTLILCARPFPMLCQIMPVYLSGEFSISPAARGFAIEEDRVLVPGDWTAQGMPFYPGAVRYLYDFQLDGPAEVLRLRLPSWEGSVVIAHLDGAKAGQIMHPPYECLLRGPLQPGAHTVAVDVLGNMKNMMGSHHLKALPLRWTFEYAPAHTPPGVDYKLSPTGLSGDIQLDRF